MFFYTLFGSLPLLFAVLSLGDTQGQIRTLAIFNVLQPFDLIGSLIVSAAFLLKLPIYLGHIWLPKAHVEAPVLGSILLAGVMLKLGSVGLVYISELNKGGIIVPVVGGLAVVGGRAIAVIVLRARDIKVIIAISSVVHIRLVCLGAFS